MLYKAVVLTFIFSYLAFTWAHSWPFGFLGTILKRFLPIMRKLNLQQTWNNFSSPGHNYAKIVVHLSFRNQATVVVPFYSGQHQNYLVRSLAWHKFMKFQGSLLNSPQNNWIREAYLEHLVKKHSPQGILEKVSVMAEFFEIPDWDKQSLGSAPVSRTLISWTVPEMRRA